MKQMKWSFTRWRVNLWDSLPQEAMDAKLCGWKRRLGRYLEERSTED